MRVLHSLKDGIVYVIEGFSLLAEFPDWMFLVTQVSPSIAYFTSVIALLPDTAAELGVSVGGTGVNVEPTESKPFYVTPEAGLVFLVLWLVAALFVGHFRFGGTNL